MLKDARAFVLLLVAMACAGGCSTTSPSSPTPTPAPTPMSSDTGIRYDNIGTSHQFIVGTPFPTENKDRAYCCWPLPVMNAGRFSYSLSSFPLNLLPSGGSSNVISASEMLLVGVNFSPAHEAVTFQWHKAVRQDTVLYTYSTGSGSYSWAYSFIGHFSWEINEPGAYYLVVDTSAGSARIDFSINDTTLADRQGRRPALAAQRIISDGGLTMARHGGGGGAGRDAEPPAIRRAK